LRVSVESCRVRERTGDGAASRVLDAALVVAGGVLGAVVVERRAVDGAGAGSSSSSSSDSSDDVSSSLLLSVSSFFDCCECKKRLWNGFFSGVDGAGVGSALAAVVVARDLTVGVVSVGVGGVRGVLSIDVRGVVLALASGSGRTVPLRPAAVVDEALELSVDVFESVLAERLVFFTAAGVEARVDCWRDKEGFDFLVSRRRRGGFCVHWCSVFVE
jgi:hypothetical protein